MIWGEIKKNKFILILLLINILLWLLRPKAGEAALVNISQFSLEILKILPPVLILMALVDIWIPKALIETHLGKDSGIKGMVLAILLGTTAAGPLFAAFPVALSLSKKGVRTSNIVIFLGAWSTIKIPMLMMESNFLGVHFTLWRFILTLPCIILIGYLVEKIAPLET